MTLTTTPLTRPERERRTPAPVDPSRSVDARRLRSPVAAAALAASAVGAVGVTLGTVVAGRLAEDPSRGLVWLLALCVVGAGVVDTAGKVAWVRHPPPAAPAPHPPAAGAAPPRAPPPPRPPPPPSFFFLIKGGGLCCFLRPGRRR